MITSIASEGDKQALRQLMEDSFQESAAFFDLYFDSFWKAENSLIVKIDGKIAGALELFPQTLRLHGKSVPACYVAGVRVAPEFRGCGVSAALMRYAHRVMCSRGVLVSLLTPFSYEFYRRMGYEVCYWLKYYEFEQIRFPKAENGTHFCRLTLDNWREMNEVYSSFCRNKNAFIDRSYQDWRFLFDMLELGDGKIYGAYRSDHSLAGYLALTQDKSSFTAHELVCREPSDASALFSFASGYFSNHHKISLYSAMGEDPGMLLGRQELEYILKPGMMAKVLDVPAAMALFPDAPSIPVEDSFEHAEKNPRKAGALDIRIFTQIFMGAAQADDFLRLGIITPAEDARRWLCKTFLKKNNYSFDWLA